MENLNDLKSIWMSAKTDSLPTSKEVVNMAKKFRNQTLRRKAMVIIGCSLSSLLMVCVMVFYHAKMWSTWTGEVLMIASCLSQIYTNIRSIGRFYHFREASNTDFLHFLEKTRQNQLYYYKKTQVFGLVLSTLGLLLYLYEFFHQNTPLMIGVYALFITYLCVVWFIVRPRTYKKNSKKLLDTQHILEQLTLARDEQQEFK